MQQKGKKPKMAFERKVRFTKCAYTPACIVPFMNHASIGNVCSASLCIEIEISSSYHHVFLWQRWYICMFKAVSLIKNFPTLLQ